ncbi:AAA family ATPase [Gilliamella sp. App2-1]|uniref:RNA-binding domain-containing protein n=1 Tax=Gilliamella sp. App2-1 TaxID=3120230 RepID=UPI00082932A1|nr:RNA-binding domain-containing protein [Gilliamella apicola]OCG24560.1 AAA family ATPase [Gilliamella apicola]
MIEINTLADIESLTETEEIEVKSAQGKDHQGQLPKDFWPTYSAMANSKGGWVILGVEEKSNKFNLIGIKDVTKIKKELVTALNNKEKVNYNLLTDKDILEKSIDNKTILIIRIHPATRDKKPIYINNSIVNAYIRMNDSDIKCDEAKIRQMILEQDPQGTDSRILDNFTIDDIEIESLQKYRNIFSARHPEHPFLKENLLSFLSKIGGWRKDRYTKKEGLTIAGLLMFGKWDAITEIIPKYSVDYIERPENKIDTRWIDRVFYDGSWSGNVFDFYQLVYPKLVSDLKVPFNIKDGVRQSDSGIHQALREALVNTLVHADYLTGRVSILVVKRPDMFGFRNPGLMLISKEDAIKGGNSECRNQKMQQMFLYIGLGERAGSGVPRIYSGWEQANWKVPNLREKYDIEQTLLELSTTSLIPHNIVDYLVKKFGYDNFSKLDDFEKMILATTAQENWINHQRACELTSKHSREVTLALPNLERKGFLISQGEKKNKIYKLFGEEELLMPEDILYANDGEIIEHDQIYRDGSLTSRNNNSGYKNKNSGYKDSDSGYKDTSSANKDSVGRIIDERVDKPFIFELTQLDNGFLQSLEKIASPTIKKRITFDEMKTVLIALCKGHYISLSALAILVNRTPDRLRQGYVKQLTKDGVLRMAFPHVPNIPKQGYTTVEEH